MRILFVLQIVFLSIFLTSCIQDFGKDSATHSVVTDSSNIKVVAFLRAAIEQRPDVTENYIRLAAIRISEGKFVEAKSLLQTAYGRNPDNEEIVTKLSLRYLEDREYYQAFALLRMAEERGINSLGLYKNFAKANYMTGDFENIPYYLNKALQFDKNDWELVYLQAEVARFKKDSIEAFVNYEKAYLLHPSDTIFNQMHDYAQEINDQSRLSYYLSDEFLVHPESPDLLIRAGSYYRVRGDIDTSFYLYRKVIKLEPGVPAAYDRMAQNFYDRRKYDSAIYYATEAVRLEEDAINARLIRARSYDKKNDYTDALEEYDQILKLDSTFTIASNELAILRRKIAYLRDIQRIRRQKEAFKGVKILESKKAVPKKD